MAEDWEINEMYASPFYSWRLDIVFFSLLVVIGAGFHYISKPSAITEAKVIESVQVKEVCKEDSIQRKMDRAGKYIPAKRVYQFCDAISGTAIKLDKHDKYIFAKNQNFNVGDVIKKISYEDCKQIVHSNEGEELVGDCLEDIVK